MGGVIRTGAFIRINMVLYENTELLIKRGIEDNSKIIFPISQQKHIL